MCITCRGCAAAAGGGSTASEPPACSLASGAPLLFFFYVCVHAPVALHLRASAAARYIQAKEKKNQAQRAAAEASAEVERYKSLHSHANTALLQSRAVLERLGSTFSY